MPSKEQRRKETNRQQTRNARRSDDGMASPGGPSTSGLQALNISAEPPASIVEGPTTKRMRSIGTAVGSSTSDAQTPVHPEGLADDESVQASVDRRPRESTPSIAVGGYANTRTSARRMTLNQQLIKKNEVRMKEVVRAYLDREWPVQTAKRQHKRSSTAMNIARCGFACDCTSYAQCHQNSSAFLASQNYIKEFKHGTAPASKFIVSTKNNKGVRPTERCHQNTDLKCAARSTGHRVDYYDSGQFGDFFCDHCGSRMLRGEHEKTKRGRQTPCCANGAIHTDQMKSEFDELQLPPVGYEQGLVIAENERVRESFLNNTMAFNNTFAFASTHGEKAPAEQMGGRLDTCKYNGQFSFQFSDLIAPGDRPPAFAQVYTLTPEDALIVREANLDMALPPPIKRGIMAKLEELMRENPFGKTFETVGTKLEEVKAVTGEIPHFQIVLLSDRDLKNDAIRHRGSVTVIERADAPTAKQVSVVWVQDDGLPPQISGFWVSDKAGKMRELKNGMPQIDPCCFPLLHPRGTLGWRWFLKKRGSVVSREEREQMQLQHLLDQSPPEGFIDDNPIEAVVGTAANEEVEEMPEPEQHLDEEVREDVANETIAVSTSAEQPTTDNDQEEDVVFDAEAPAAGGRTNISERQFYRYRMALRGSGKNSFHWLWFARRLAEYFTITVLNRIERNDLDHLKAIQAKRNYRQILAREYIAAMEKGVRQHGPNARLGRVFLMPQTFAGSRQYYQGKYADLMTMVRHLGAPTWFVTFTGNPKWPEIEEALRVRQNYVHRPDIVCRIFMDKATEFIKDLTERSVLGKVAGWCYSVEHQKRGMPHIHMLLILAKEVRITTPEQVDEYVCARIPTLPPANNQSPEATQQRRLWHYVTTMMLHDCNATCLEGSRCRKHFPKPYSDRTELSEVRYTNYVRLPPDESDTFFGQGSGYDYLPLDDDHTPNADPERDWAEVRYQRIPHQGRIPGRQHGEHGQTHYKKRKGVRSTLLLDDSRVIPYNPFLLLKYGCHINVEYVFGQKACKYIFKYLLKGFEKAYVRVAQPRRRAAQQNDGAGADEIYDYDEIAATFKVRYMTAMEAFLRLNSYKIVGTSHQIYTLSVHDEGGQTIVVEEGHEEEGRWKVKENTRLTAFFKLCVSDPDAAGLTYDRVPYYFSWDYKARSWKKRVRALSEDPEKARMFVRVYTVSPRKHELFALRTLLLHRPGPKSFVHLRTIDGIRFTSFAGACQHLGLQVSDEVFRRSMQEAGAEMSNLKRLQHFFAMLLAHGHPSDPQRLFDEFLDEMNPPAAAYHPGAGTSVCGFEQKNDRLFGG